MQRKGRLPVENERLARKLRSRSPNGERRRTTERPRRNMIVVDFGDDVHGVRAALEAKAFAESRTISSITREILRVVLIDLQFR